MCANATIQASYDTIFAKNAEKMRKRGSQIVTIQASNELLLPKNTICLETLLCKLQKTRKFQKIVKQSDSQNVTIHDSNEHLDTVATNQKPKII